MVIHMKKKYLSRQSSDLNKWNVLYITYMCWNFKRRQHLLTKNYKMQRSVPPLIQGISEHVVFYLLGNIYYSVYRAKQRGIIASKNCQPCKKKYTHWKNKKCYLFWRISVKRTTYDIIKIRVDLQVF